MLRCRRPSLLSTGLQLRRMFKRLYTRLIAAELTVCLLHFVSFRSGVGISEFGVLRADRQRKVRDPLDSLLGAEQDTARASTL